MLLEIGIFVGIFLGAIVISLYCSVERMTAVPQVEERPDLADEIQARVHPEVAAFIATKSFRFEGAYQFHLVQVGRWIQAGPPLPMRRFSASFVLARANYEFITEFSDDDSLTTTRNRAAFVFPRPFGSFLQSFPNASIERLWAMHCSGERHLMAELSIPVRPCRLSFREGFAPAVLRQMRCIKSLPLWPVRGIYWYLAKRFLLQNRPIWVQNVAELYKKVA